VQHFIYHLAPHGLAGFVLANGSLSSNQSGEGEIRKAIVEADIVDCIVSLPGQLFYTTQIPVSLWFLARDKSNGILKDKRLRDRRGETLFIDAREFGRMETRTLRVLDNVDDPSSGRRNDIGRIVEAYHAWREARSGYADVSGFCKAVKTEQIVTHSFVLTPRDVCPRLSSDEKKLFDVIVRAYLAALMPDFRYRQTTATLDVRGFEFRASGRQPIDLGWRAAFPDWQPADEKGDEAQLLPPLRNGETAQLHDPKIEDKETRPPPRYNEAL
jgi:type I restriction-modification system DNA methylase subunit